MPAETKDNEVVVEDQAESADDADKSRYGPALMAMLSDREINQVIQAKKNNQTVRVVVEDDDDAVSDDGEDDDEAGEEEDTEVEDGTTTRKQLIDGVLKAIDKKLKPFSDRLEMIEGLADEVQKGSIQREVAEVKGKHEDFEKYHKAMSALSKQIPGLRVEEYYLLAKARAGDLALEKPSTFSEKPTGARTRIDRNARKEREGSMKRGSRGFKTRLHDVLDEMDLSTTG